MQIVALLFNLVSDVALVFGVKFKVMLDLGFVSGFNNGVGPAFAS